MRLPWVPRWLYEETKERARIAEDRLYAAHKDGAIIPPREMMMPGKPVVLEALPAKVAGYVQNWESVETRQALDQEARKLMELGMTEDRIIELWQARTGEGVSREMAES
jgi:hypothetical protein